MAISGIVIVLHRQPAEVIPWLASLPYLELGQAPGDFPERLPAVLEAPSFDVARARVRELEQHPGVQKVDVIHVGFEESDELPPNPFDRPGRRVPPERSIP